MNGDLPEGWALARISDVTERVANIRPKDRPNREFVYVDISAIDNRQFTIAAPRRLKGSEAPSRAQRPIRPGDTLFSNVRTYLRNIALVPDSMPEGVCSTGFTVLRPNSAAEPGYLFRYVLSSDFIDRVTPQQTGTHYPATSDRKIFAETIALPPLAEQRRLISVLGRALDRTAECRERLSRLSEEIGRLRQSVLAAACSGRLTADWREHRGVSKVTSDILESIQRRRARAAKNERERAAARDLHSGEEQGESAELPVGWQFIHLGKLCRSFEYGTSAKSQPDGRVPVLRMGNVQQGEIDWSDLVYTSDTSEIARYSLSPMTVLFNRTNSPELVGKTAIYRGERPAIFAGYLIRINPYPELDPEYLNLCLNTTAARDFCLSVKSDGVSQSNINAKKLAVFEVPYCDLQEQREIVRRVKALLVVASRIEAGLKTAEAKVEKLMPALLAKAFRGELVPTEAELAAAEGRAYETATELLQLIRASSTTRLADSARPRPTRNQRRRNARNL